MKFRRPSGALVASLIAHAVIIVIFAQAIVLQHPLFDLFGREEEKIPPPERIGFIAYPAGTLEGDAKTPARHEPSNRTPVAPPKIVAPRSIPTTVPKAPDKAEEKPAEAAGPSTGPLVGGKGNLRGVQPRYQDPRLWPQPGAIATAPTVPKTDAQRLDSVIADVLGPQKDSMQVASKERQPGDWTIEKGGKKYGVDRQYIRLGPVSIPTAILALLPLNTTGNPTVVERERRNSYMREDIMRGAQYQINDADFQKAVKAIRERKERERREAEEKNKAADKSAASDKK